MADLYGEFDDSDDMEDNDEEIGALGSILSWDDEDDAAVTDAVAATTSALEEHDTSLSTLPPLPSFQTYPQQVSIIGMNGGTPAANQQQQQQYQMIMQGYRMPVQGAAQTQQQAQQQQLTMTQGQNQQQMVQQVHMQPGQAFSGMPQQAQQQQVMTQQMATTQQMAGTQQQQQSQQVAVQQPAQQQQLQQAGRPVMSAAAAGTQRAPAGYAAVYQQQMFPAGAEQLSLPPNVVMQASQQQDPNAFLRQMQIQYQRVPGAATGGLQPVMMQAPMMAAPPVQAVTSTVRKAPVKRKATTEIRPPAAVKSTVVSCSDTDGESKLAVEAMKRTSKKQKILDEKALEDMSPAEKAKANRDRNREHARNTRLRKKAYLEKLKSTVDELCRERDTLVSERAGASNLLVEMHNTRTEVLMSFFALRSGYERKREMWASILDDSCFSCVVPVTPYRSFPASEVQVSNCQRTIMGIDGMMADTASLHVLLNSLVDRSRYPTARIQFRFTLVTEDAVVAGNQMMSRWVMTTSNAMQLGARMEVAKQGMLCCKFNSAHKIIGLELMFDVMAFMLQLKQATGSPEFGIVPNTVQTCQKSFDSPMVMTQAESPYTIVQVNKLWEELTGYKAEDVVGKASCRILQGQDTDRSAVSMLMSEVRYKRPASAVILNYTKEGKRFRNYMHVYPLSTNSKITHYVALSTHTEPVDDGSISSASSQGVLSQAPIQPQVATVAGIVKPAPQMMQAPTTMVPQGAMVMQAQPGMAVPMNGGAPIAYLAAQQQQQMFAKHGAPQFQIIQPIATPAPAPLPVESAQFQQPKPTEK